MPRVMVVAPLLVVIAVMVLAAPLTITGMLSPEAAVSTSLIATLLVLEDMVVLTVRRLLLSDITAGPNILASVVSTKRTPASLPTSP